MLDRKGKGTETYGFAAWMSRWNKCLADLLHIANLPIFAANIPAVRSSGLLDQDQPIIFYKPDRVGERLTSVDLLHHPGFYYLAAAEMTKIRQARAKRISLEDKDTSYDTYLCPLPKEEREVDHATIQMSLLVLARIEFELRQQERMAESVSYQLAQIRMVKAPENPKYWLESLKDLRGIASRYRKEGWWNLLEDVLWRIVECGRQGGDPGSVVIAEFELLCSPIFKARPGRKYDLANCLGGMAKGTIYPTIVARASDVVNICKSRSPVMSDCI